MDMFKKQDTGPTPEERLRAIEAKLDAIIAHFGIGASTAAAPPLPADNDPSSMPDVMELVRNGRLIPAIKIYRDRTGLGLKESKDAIDHVSRRAGR